MSCLEHQGNKLGKTKVLAELTTCQELSRTSPMSIHSVPTTALWEGLGEGKDELGVGLWGWGQGWDLALPQEPPCGSGDGADSGALRLWPAPS